MTPPHAKLAFTVPVGLLLAVAAARAPAAPRDVQFSIIDFETNVIELTNFGNESVSMAGWQLCTHDDRFSRLYSPGNRLNAITLQSGETLSLHFNNDAPGGDPLALNVNALEPIAEDLDRGPYSINLYQNANFDSGAAMVDHVQWSIDGISNVIADERTDEAVSGGLWASFGDWIATTPETLRIELILEGNGQPPPGVHSSASYLVSEPSPLSPADFDGNGEVNGDDLAIWEAAFGQTTAGDADGDGVTNGDDVLKWQQDVTGASSVVGPIPEPACMLLAVTALAAAGACYRPNRCAG